MLLNIQPYSEIFSWQSELELGKICSFLAFQALQYFASSFFMIIPLLP